MNKPKIVILSLITIFLINTGTAFSIDTQNTNNVKDGPKPLQAQLKDYRLEYINKDWWDKFHDPVLKEYILKAVNDNYDLKNATLKVAEARAAAREAFGKELPSLDLGSSYSRNKTSANTSMGSLQIPSYTQDAYNFPLSVNYELDLWRKNRLNTLSMEKELEAAKYDEKAAYISLCSSVAAAYFNLISLDKQIELQKDIISLRKDIFDLSKDNNEYGLVSTTDVILADKSLRDAQSSLNDLEKNRSIFLNQLVILTGNSVEKAPSFKRESIDKIDLIKDLPQSISSDIVQKRPDILEAEAELKKSKIDISIARRDFLPDFSITGDFGFNANSLSKVFDWNSYISSIGVNVLQGLFSGGQKTARLKRKKIQI